MAQTWIVRAGRDGELEEIAFQRNVVVVGWREVGDLTGCTTLDQIRTAVAAGYPDTSPRLAESHAFQLFAFRSKMSPGDLVLMVSGMSGDLAIGRVIGQYEYRTDLAGGIRHARQVAWLRRGLSRLAVRQDLISSPVLTAVFRLNRADAPSRLLDVARNGIDPAIDRLDADAPTAPGAASPATAAFANLQRNLEYARSLARAGESLAKLGVTSFEVPDVFRAAWVQSVAALDHWVRQEVHNRMLRLAAQPEAEKPARFRTFSIPLSLLEDVQHRSVPITEALDQHLRTFLGFATFQQPDKIQEAFGLVSDRKGLWDRVAKVLSEEGGGVGTVTASDLRARLADVVRRRNKIAHEYDEDPDNPHAKREIDAATVTQTIDWIEQVASAVLVVLDGE